jgi:hypothetical protein
LNNSILWRPYAVVLAAERCTGLITITAGAVGKMNEGLRLIVVAINEWQLYIGEAEVR